MKYNKLFVALVCALGVLMAHGQTKRIAHLGHSGSIATFTDGAFDLDGSNFGDVPRRIVHSAKLDSLIFLDTHRAVMVTSAYCLDEYAHKPKETLWRAGRDTVVDHPHFSLQHGLDSIKKVLTESYHFRNSVKTVKFIGYDNKPHKPKDDRYQAPTTHPNQQQNQQQNQHSGGNQEAAMLPILGGNGGGGSSSGLLMWAICLAAVLSVGVGIWAKAKPKQA